MKYLNLEHDKTPHSNKNGDPAHAVFKIYLAGVTMSGGNGSWGVYCGASTDSPLFLEIGSGFCRSHESSKFVNS